MTNEIKIEIMLWYMGVLVMTGIAMFMILLFYTVFVMLQYVGMIL